MNNSFLICGFPRSRTMWLSHFLTVPGKSVCTHEATENAGSAKEFWDNAERFAGGHLDYGNSDSANIFVLPALLAERPLTRVVWIERPIVEVCQSMKRANLPFDEASARTLMKLRDQYKEHFDMVLHFQDLYRMDTCWALWKWVLPEVEFELGRWGIFYVKNICYTAAHPPPKQNTAKFLAWVNQELQQESRKEG